MKTKGVTDVETAIEMPASAIVERQPEDVRNPSYKKGEGAIFVGLLDLEDEEERDLLFTGGLRHHEITARGSPACRSSLSSTIIRSEVIRNGC